MSGTIVPAPKPGESGPKVSGRTETGKRRQNAAGPIRSNGWMRTVGRAAHGLSVSAWLAGDLAILLLTTIWSFQLFPPVEMKHTPHVELWQACAVFAFALTVSAFVFGLYERDTMRSRLRIVTRMLLAVGVATVVAYTIIHVVMYATISRRMAALVMTTSFASGTLFRMIASFAMDQARRGLLVVGSRELFESFRRAREDGTLSEYELVGLATIDQYGVATPTDDTIKTLGNVRDVIPWVPELGVTDIVVGRAAARHADISQWLLPALRQGCRVTNEAIFFEKATGQILVDEITPEWFLFADLKVHCDRHATMQRGFDLFVATLGLLVTLPLWPLVAIAIKLCDGGPVFYSQERVGQNGRVFRLLKFRTMRTDAECGKSVWATPNDPRVTAVGRILRRTRLDEFPQLFNVLLGQMSIVGPRPERPDIVADLDQEIPWYAERHLVKPGVTGWAQISFRYGSSIEDARRKLQYDLYYLKHMSFELNLIIVLRTIGTLMRGAC